MNAQNGTRTIPFCFSPQHSAHLLSSSVPVCLAVFKTSFFFFFSSILSDEIIQVQGIMAMGSLILSTFLHWHHNQLDFILY